MCWWQGVVEGIVLGKLIERAEGACWCCGAGLPGARVDVHNGANRLVGKVEGGLVIVVVEVV